MAVVRACAAAASACGAALAALWTRCQLALQCLFGGPASQDAAPCSCSCTRACSTISPVSTATDTADETEIPTPSTTTAAKDDADCSKQLVATATDGFADATADATDDAAPAHGLIEEPEQEEEPAQELADHVVSVDDPLTAAVMEQLIARHEALGPFPRDTISQLISCLHAPHRDRASALGVADAVAMVDVVLFVLARRKFQFNVAATYAYLSTRWLLRLRRRHLRNQLAQDIAMCEHLLKTRPRVSAQNSAPGTADVSP